ncbi:MAG: type IX secretion system membrane protein PorP/SprF, partial [Mariniphaga sp.]
RHYYLTSGYVFDLGTYLKFKPTFMIKAVKNAPLSYDLTGNFLLGEKFWLGGMYRSGDSFGFIAQWIIDGQLRLGYAIDFTLSKLQNYQNGTHEVMISYELGIHRKWTSPRYF